ncbi:Ribosomal RNA-processing protein 15 [Nakaseomyces bracarensis]|uniref:Ribosomal RNA-processing protein 15 n=1 Tax=Nakaseomyces bracarensis TaxID=273131 RepID=A0ABR4P0Q3_9SACH
MALKHKVTLKKKPEGKKEKKPISLPSSDISGSESSSEEHEEVEHAEEEDENSEEVSDEEASEEASEEEEQEEEDDDSFPRKKKAKMSKHDDGSAGFSTALNAILGSHLKAYDRKDPIMSRNKQVLKQNESQKLEAKAKRALLAEKKKLLNKTRKKEIIPLVSGDGQSGEEIRNVIEKETRLRKIAQKGAVKLFNAILSTQVRTDKEASEGFTDIKNRNEKKQLITEVSKEKFLDMVKAAGDDDE